MSVKLQTENIKLSETVNAQYTRTTVDCDIIVPDVKPDLLKILRVNSNAAIIEKEVLTDKVQMKGTIRIDILYIPDGNVIGNVKSITEVREFVHVVEAPGAKSGMWVAAEVECDQPEYNMVNSRKLNVRNTVNIGLKVTGETQIQIADSVDRDEEILTKFDRLKICNTCCDAERSITVKERLEVPSGKPEIGEILRFCARPVSEELRLIENKAIVKGEVQVSTLYCGNDEENSIQHMEHTVPFTEILDIEGISEDMSGEIYYSLKDYTCEICHDSDGDNRIIGVEIVLCACIRATEIIEHDVICDAFGLKKEIIPERTCHNIERLLDVRSSVVSLRESVSVPDYLPEVIRVVDCSAFPNIESVNTEKGKALVRGYITCNLLYMSDDVQVPVSGFSHIISFEHTFDIPGLDEQSVCEANSDVEHLSYTITDGRSIDIRPNVVLSLKAVKPENCEFISGIEIDEEKVIPHMPAMVVYFIRPGDTLWEIAKRYRITPDAILESNNVDPDNLQVGSPIYIFR